MTGHPSTGNFAHKKASVGPNRFLGGLGDWGGSPGLRVLSHCWVALALDLKVTFCGSRT